MINIDDFIKVELKVGTVLEAEEVVGSDKLIRQVVDLGEDKPRQILSGIKEWYSPKQLVGKQFIYVTNLESRKLMGLESQGMILCADGKKPVPLKPSSRVPPGTRIR